MGLLIDSQSDHSIHCEHFLAELHTLLDSFVAVLGDFHQPLLCIVKKCNFSLLSDQLLLELFVLLEQKVECILQVLIAIHKHLIILVQIVHQILHKEQVICVKWR